MMNKGFKREYKWSFDKETHQGFVIGIGVYNEQPKTKYRTASIVFGLAILFWTWSWRLSYNYKIKD
jgi:hypothetical protein